MINLENKKLRIFFICVISIGFIALTVINNQLRIRVIDLNRELSTYKSSQKKLGMFDNYTGKLIGGKLPKIVVNWQNYKNINISPYLINKNKPFILMIKSKKGCLSCFEIVVSEWSDKLLNLTKNKKINIAVIAPFADKDIISNKFNGIDIKNVSYSSLSNLTYEDIGIQEATSAVFFIDEQGRILFAERLELSRIKMLKIFIHKVSQYIENNSISLRSNLNYNLVKAAKKEN